ncbi:MAG TPA: hypothetical protein VHZ76_09810 [Gammaproteobacteria bacterium]|jgi:hypothetical protein|nr:hypothetical protein [Gammaproteobacteria bacterium]
MKLYYYLGSTNYQNAENQTITFSTDAEYYQAARQAFLDAFSGQALATNVATIQKNIKKLHKSYKYSVNNYDDYINSSAVVEIEIDDENLNELQTAFGYGIKEETDGYLSITNLNESISNLGWNDKYAFWIRARINLITKGQKNNQQEIILDDKFLDEMQIAALQIFEEEAATRLKEELAVHRLQQEAVEARRLAEQARIEAEKIAAEIAAEKARADAIRKHEAKLEKDVETKIENQSHQEKELQKATKKFETESALFSAINTFSATHEEQRNAEEKKRVAETNLLLAQKAFAGAKLDTAAAESKLSAFRRVNSSEARSEQNSAHLIESQELAMEVAMREFILAELNAEQAEKLLAETAAMPQDRYEFAARSVFTNEIPAKKTLFSKYFTMQDEDKKKKAEESKKDKELGYFDFAPDDFNNEDADDVAPNITAQQTTQPSNGKYFILEDWTDEQTQSTYNLAEDKSFDLEAGTDEIVTYSQPEEMISDEELMSDWVNIGNTKDESGDPLIPEEVIIYTPAAFDELAASETLATTTTTSATKQRSNSAENFMQFFLINSIKNIAPGNDISQNIEKGKALVTLLSSSIHDQATLTLQDILAHDPIMSKDRVKALIKNRKDMIVAYIKSLSDEDQSKIKLLDRILDYDLKNLNKTTDALAEFIWISRNSSADANINHGALGELNTERKRIRKMVSANLHADDKIVGANQPRTASNNLSFFRSFSPIVGSLATSSQPKLAITTGSNNELSTADEAQHSSEKKSRLNFFSRQLVKLAEKITSSTSSLDNESERQEKQTAEIHLL